MTVGKVDLRVVCSFDYEGITAFTILNCLAAESLAAHGGQQTYCSFQTNLEPSSFDAISFTHLPYLERPLCSTFFITYKLEIEKFRNKYFFFPDDKYS